MKITYEYVLYENIFDVSRKPPNLAEAYRDYHQHWEDVWLQAYSIRLKSYSDSKEADLALRGKQNYWDEVVHGTQQSVIRCHVFTLETMAVSEQQGMAVQKIGTRIAEDQKER